MLRMSLAAVMVVFALTACGGDDESAQTPSPTPQPDATTVEQADTSTEGAASEMTHEEFVSKLDAWCKAGNAEAQERWSAPVDEATESGDYQELADLLEERQEWAAEEEQELPVAEEGLSDADAESFRNYLALNDRINGLIDRYIAALRETDDTELTRLAELVDEARNERTNLAVDMGLTSCGS